MPSIAPLDTAGEGIGHVELAGFLGDAAFFASVSGELHLAEGRHRVIRLHDGLLAACLTADGKALVTSGEDGLIRRFSGEGEPETVHSVPGKWIDRLATGPGGAIGWASGRKGGVLVPGSPERPFGSERSIEALAFAPKGMRIAIARYNGVELLWINTESPAQFLEWKGAHTGVTFSPDGRYVVSTMQENALHGWRLSDGKHMRMTGYPAKVKSLSWSAKGKWLASSGAPAAIVWPFSGKDGPMGQAPKELGAFGNLMVTVVACHPEEEVVAIGYEDGMVLAVRVADGKEALLRRGGGGALSALAWDRSGRRLAYGTQTGEAGVIDIAG